VKIVHLSRAERKIIEPVLIKYTGFFLDNENNYFKSTNVVVRKIETGITTPIRKANSTFFKTGNEQAGSEDVRQRYQNSKLLSLVIASSVGAKEVRELSSEIQVLR
jgi:hypothetical protein